jgi:hypothetical protein
MSVLLSQNIKKFVPKILCFLCLEIIKISCLVKLFVKCVNILPINEYNNLTNVMTFCILILLRYRSLNGCKGKSEASGLWKRRPPFFIHTF